jgi:8-oxo-dGTP pyrophosphatase MutT (NUDIX family)
MKITRSQIRKILKESIGKRYWGIGGSGIIFVCLEDKTIFLQKRSENISSGGGQWAQPGGGIFPPNEIETYWFTPIPKNLQLSNNDPRFYQTAVKEVKEECGSCPPHTVLDSFIYNDSGFKYKTFIVNMKKSDKDLWVPEAEAEHAWESSDMRWFDISKFRQLDLFFGFVPELIQKVTRLIS